METTTLEIASTTNQILLNNQTINENIEIVAIMIMILVAISIIDFIRRFLKPLKT